MTLLCSLAGGDAMDDFWYLDSTSLTWTYIARSSVKGPFPAKRHSMAFATVSEDTIVMYGGSSQGRLRTCPVLASRGVFYHHIYRQRRKGIKFCVSACVMSSKLSTICLFSGYRTSLERPLRIQSIAQRIPICTEF